MIIAHFTRSNRQAARQGQQVFRRAIALREAIYPVLLSYVESDRPPPVHLSQLSDEAFRFTWEDSGHGQRRQVPAMGRARVRSGRPTVANRVVRLSLNAR